MPKLVIEIDGNDEGNAVAPREVARIKPYAPEIPRSKPFAAELHSDSYLDRLVQSAVRAAPPSSSPPPPEPPPDEIEAAALKLCDAMAGDVYGWAGGDGERRIILNVAMSGPGVESSPFNKNLMAAYYHAVCWMVRAKLVTVDFGIPPKDAAGTSIPKNQDSEGRVTSLRASLELWNRKRAGSIFGRSTELRSHLFRLIDTGDVLALVPHRWHELTPLHPNGYDEGIREQPEIWHAVFGGIGVAAGTQGATGPDTLQSVPDGMVQRASAELHGEAEPTAIIREMGNWLERWGRAFHPFAPATDRESIYREQAALPVEWWLHRRGLLETLTRLGVMVPDDLTARPALNQTWNRRELVSHRDLMGWLCCSRPFVQYPAAREVAPATPPASKAKQSKHKRIRQQNSDIWTKCWFRIRSSFAPMCSGCSVPVRP